MEYFFWIYSADTRVFIPYQLPTSQIARYMVRNQLFTRLRYRMRQVWTGVCVERLKILNVCWIKSSLHTGQYVTVFCNT
jgi:hypothetical protein